ncbi:MAG TPA: S-layer homology domain-containing protein [Thermoleophilia bacterium]
MAPRPQSPRCCRALGLAGAALAFTDTSGSPYATAINDLSSRHIISGFNDNTFRPGDPVTRQQFAKIIVLARGDKVPASTACPFTDVDQTPNPNDPLYPAKYVGFCAKLGITTGKTPTTFDPLSSITRQQLITMVARAADLPAPAASFKATFTEGQFSSTDHFANARKAAAAGLLDGLVGVGPNFDFLAPATRGECAQVLSNLLNGVVPDTSLPVFASLKPAGPVGFTFRLDTPIIWAAQHENDGIWPKTLDAGTLSGHITVQMVAVGDGKATIKLAIDSLTIPENDVVDPQTDLSNVLPAYLLLQVDNQGKILAISYGSKGKPEQALDQQMVAGLSTFITPITAALMVPYSGQLAKPGDSSHPPTVTYTGLGKKLMDVDTKIDYLSFASGVAKLGVNVAATNIDIPLRFDFRVLLRLIGYTGPTGNDPWIMDMSVGTSVNATGEYDLDTKSGLPTGLTLSSTMMFDMYVHQTPPQLLSVWPTSDFAHGWVDHVYLRAAVKSSPFTVTFSLTKDAGQ